MSGLQETREKARARSVLLALVVLAGVLAIAVVVSLSLVGGFVDTHFTPGLGLKNASILAFVATMVVMVVFAIAAGDGFLGEIQFMIAGFAGFFVVLWLLLAWVF